MRKRRLFPSYTDDPVADYDSYCACQDALHDMLPMCIECDNRIEDDMCWDFGDGPMCEECAERLYRKRTEDVME